MDKNNILCVYTGKDNDVEMKLKGEYVKKETSHLDEYRPDISNKRNGSNGDEIKKNDGGE